MTIRSRPRRKKPKWQKVLTNGEIQHLKGVHVLTRKSFIEMNDTHNKRRQEVAALEPCYWCKHIALKMGLEVHGMSKLVAVKTEKPVMQAVELIDNNKPEPVADKVFDLPLVYIIIMVSTVAFGIASAVVYWKGW